MKQLSKQCPPRLKRTRIIEVDEFQFKVVYNYVAEGEHGIMPFNCWYVFLATCPYSLMMTVTLKEDIETLEQACEFIRPYLVIAVRRWRERNAAA